MRKLRIDHLVLFSVLVALAFVFSWLEFMIPNPMETIAPGIKLGLANLVVLIALYRLGPGAAVSISVLRVLLTAFTFGNLSMMVYSLSGAVFSYVVMLLLKCFLHLGPIGVSTAGGVAHNLGQILVASLALGEGLAYYFPILLFSGILSGILIGILGALVLLRLPQNRN